MNTESSKKLLYPRSSHSEILLPYCCPFLDCKIHNKQTKQKRGFTGVCADKSLRNHLNDSHADDLGILPKKTWTELSKFDLCHRCNLLQPKKRKHICLSDGMSRDCVGEETGVRDPKEDLEEVLELPGNLFDLTWEKITRINLNTLSEVPFRWRKPIAGCFTKILSSISINPSNIENWKILFCTPMFLLRRSSTKTTESSLNKLISYRVQLYMDGMFGELAADLTQEPQHSYSSSQVTQTQSRLKCASVLCLQGKPGKALSRLMSAGLAPNTDPSFKVLREKHPQVDDEVKLPQSEEKVEFTEAICFSSLKDFDKTTGTCVSSMRVGHLLECLEVDKSKACLKP